MLIHSKYNHSLNNVNFVMKSTVKSSKSVLQIHQPVGKLQESGFPKHSKNLERISSIFQQNKERLFSRELTYPQCLADNVFRKGMEGEGERKSTSNSHSNTNSH